MNILYIYECKDLKDKANASVITLRTTVRKSNNHFGLEKLKKWSKASGLKLKCQKNRQTHICEVKDLADSLI